MSLVIKPKDISTDMTTDTELAAESAILQSEIDKITEIHTKTNEPTGYVDRTQSTLSFDESTRTLSLAPVSTSFDIYVSGNKLTISSTLTKQIPNTSGTYFFYIDANGVLNYQTAFSTSLLSTQASTAFILWNSTLGKAISFGEERHGCIMDSATHSYLHTTRGTQLASGASIGYTTNGNGTLDADSQVSVSDLSLTDEDITVSITNNASPSLPFQQKLSPIAYIPIYYRIGTEWYKDTGTAFPIKQGTLRAKYNKNTSGTWSLEDASADNKYLVSYVFATTHLSEPVVCILGQDEYTSLEDAQARAMWSKISFGDLPAQEIKLMYIIMYETSSTYSNTPKTIIKYVSDLRYGADREASATSLNTAHANLSGLLADDHTQYILVNGSRAFTGDQSFGTHSITNVNTINGITVNGIEAPQSVSSANSAGSSTVLARADHVHTIGNGIVTDAMIASGIDAAKIDGGQVSNLEFSYLANVTSDIQTQLNGKQATGNYITALTGDVSASGPGSATATLANSGVTAGTYSLVTVDAKGRVTAGSNAGSVTRYGYATTSNNTNSNATYTTVTQLTSVSLPAGLYKVTFRGQAQSAGTTNGMGLRIINGTASVSTVGIKWAISQAANGTAQTFQYDQTALTTNVTSASVQTANANLVCMGDGMIRVTTAGTLVVQFRSDLNGTVATLLTDSFVEYQLV